MYKMEVIFKEDLPNVEKYCEAVDVIFGRYNLPCLVKERNRRVYGDSGDPKDVGRLFDCVSVISDSEPMVKAISGGYWINGERKESLMDDFFKVENGNK